MPLVRRAYCWWKGRKDAEFVATSGFAFLPPATLRFHVGSIDPEAYVGIGENCVADLENALRGLGRELGSFESVLDFGCGCGRTLAWLQGRVDRIHGSDLHEECVAWCGQHIPFADSRRNGKLPPLDFEDEAFDLLFAISVFTHLNEGDQLEWLAELRRVTRPGAFLLLTVHGPSTWSTLSAEEQTVLEQQGFLAKQARALWGVFDEYFNSYHAESYVRNTWSQYFEVLAHLSRGMNNHQDLVVLRRR